MTRWLSCLVLAASLSYAQTANLAGLYQELTSRVFANQTSFYIYQDQDSALNHGFPSGWFGASSIQNNLNQYIQLDTGCVDDANAPNGCSSDITKLDQTRGTVVRITFAPLTSGLFAGVNIEEPENWGALQYGNGYDLTGATTLVFDARSPDSAQVQFGMGECTTDYMALTPAWQTITIPLSSLSCSPNLADVHVLFGVATNDVHAPNGATVLLDNIRYDPVPSNRSSALGFPVGNQTFGAVPVADFLTGRVAVPPDQVLRNLTTIYESALTEFSLLARGQPSDLQGALLVANTFDYALGHDSHGDPLPRGSNSSVGAHNGYEGGDIALYNDQPAPKLGKAGDIRLSGFSIISNACGASNFCLVLDGATGGNNAFAIMALLAAYQQFQDQHYLNDARTIGTWIVSNLTDTSGTGFGGYYVGYPDEGAAKTLENGKSTENNADIFAAFTQLAGATAQVGDAAESASWQAAANVAGDFVMQMYDSANGRFNSGTVPTGTPAQAGICPTGATKGGDVINTCDFLDADTFTTLALAWAPRYRNEIDWHVPVQYGWDHFFQSVTAEGQSYQGFDIVSQPTAGPNGVAWEFTGQMCAAMQFVDSLYNDQRYASQIPQCLSWLAQAQSAAPFGDQQGLVASTMQDGDMLTAYEQCVSTPYQCIAERVGLAATNWAILANDGINPFRPAFTITSAQLHQVSVGADGTTWGLGDDGAIYTYDTQAQNWTTVPGTLMQIAVGSKNAIWGLNAQYQIFRWDAEANGWDLIPGSLWEIAVGADGDLWGTNQFEQIYHFNAQAQNWTEIPGALASIAVGFDGAVWGVNDADEIFRFNIVTGRFEQVPGALHQISVGGDGEVWGTNGASHVYRFNRLTQQWEDTGGFFAAVSVGSGTNVWAQGQPLVTYRFNGQGGNWVEIPSAYFILPAVSANGSVWAVGDLDYVYQFASTVEPADVFHPVAGALKSVAAGTDGSVWGVNQAGQIYTFNAVTQGWINIPGALNQIAVANSENVWGLNAYDQIYRWDVASQDWVNVPGSLSQIAVGANGDVWGLNSGNEIYHLNAATQEWTWTPGSLKQISVGADGSAWGVNDQNAIYRFNEAAQRWVQIAGTLTQISVGLASNVWGINPEGSTYRWDATGQFWVYVPGATLTHISVAFDGAVWGVDALNQVWYFNGQNWVQIPGSLAQITVGADAVIWGLDSNGAIYFYR